MFIRGLPGLPPSNITQKGDDSLRDEGIMYAETFEEAGRGVTCGHYPTANFKTN